MCLSLHGLSHSGLSNLPVRVVLLLSQFLEEEIEARDMTQPRVTLGPLCMLVDFTGKRGSSGWDWGMVAWGKWHSFSEPQFLNLKKCSNSCYSGGL